jgi:hypothetical protein
VSHKLSVWKTTTARTPPRECLLRNGQAARFATLPAAFRLTSTLGSFAPRASNAISENGEMVILANDTWQASNLTSSRAAARPNDVPGSSAAPVTRLKARRTATDSELHALRLRTFLADPRTRERASQKLSVEAALAGRGASKLLAVLVHSWRPVGRDERPSLRSIRAQRGAAVRCRRPDRREAGSRTAWSDSRPHDGRGTRNRGRARSQLAGRAGEQ